MTSISPSLARDALELVKISAIAPFMPIQLLTDTSLRQFAQQEQVPAEEEEVAAA